jgi:formyl-CoA transferase
MKIFGAAEVTATAVYDIDQFLEDPHVQARGVVVEVPDADAGSVLMHNIIPRLSRTPGKLRTPAPNLGEHTGEILARLGVSEEQRAALAAKGAIKEG